MTNEQNAKPYNRKSLRLNGFDYSTPSLYFITICTQNHKCLFGKIEKQEMTLNDAGKMVDYWYNRLESKFNDIKCCDMVVMPNHFHCIIQKKMTSNQLKNTSIIEVIQWFKTMTTNEYIRGVKQLGWQRFDGKLWQRSYWDHIIRNQKSYVSISEYIHHNILNWEFDQLYKL